MAVGTPTFCQLPARRRRGLGAHWIRRRPIVLLALIVGFAAVALGVTVLYYLNSFISLPIL